MNLRSALGITVCMALGTTAASGLEPVRARGIGARASGWPATIELTEPIGLARRHEPVSVGVPLPRTPAITSVRQLGLLSPEGQPVPAQFRVLSRWFGPVDRTELPIKWVRVHLQADVPAHGTVRYGLAPGGQLSMRALARDDTGAVTVDTGPLSFQLPHAAFRVLENVRIDLDGDGQLDARLIDEGHAGGVYVRDLDGNDSSPTDDTDVRTVIEEAGPLMSVIRVSGRRRLPLRHATAWLQFTARIDAYRDKPWVRIRFTLGNPRPRTGESTTVSFDSLSLVLPVSTLGDPLRVTFAGDVRDANRPVTRAIPLQEMASVYQDSSGGAFWQDSEDGAWGTTFAGYTAAVGSRLLHRGARFGGWADVATLTWGVGVAVHDFWQNFPKGLRFAGDGRIGIDLWPEQFRVPHRLESGIEKTHEVLLLFHRRPLESSARFDASAAPLLARPDPDWVMRTFAAGPFSPAHDNDPLAALSLQLADPQHGLMAQREQADTFGWRNWGDDYWHGSKQQRRFANNRLDLLYGLVREAMRAPEPQPALFSLARAAARHVADIDLEHRTGGAALPRRADRPSDADHGAPPDLAAPWVRGLVQYAWITGDPRIEAELHGLAAGVLAATELHSFRPETAPAPRVAGALLALTDLWEYLGEPELLRRASELAATAPRLSGCPPGADEVEISWPLALGRYATSRRTAGQPDPGAEQALERMLGRLAGCPVPATLGARRQRADAFAFGALLADTASARASDLEAAARAFTPGPARSDDPAAALRFGEVWLWLRSNLGEDGVSSSVSR